MNTFSLIDTALDRTIALGYGDVGYQIRRRLPTWPADAPRIDGKRVLITGAASGVGLAAAVGYAALGADVLALARNQRRAEDAVAQITKAVPDADVRALACDVSNLAELHNFCAELSRREPRLDVLVNNAGVMPDERECSADGHELMFATHVLATFALTSWLRELLERSAPARVINVSSGGMYTQRVPADDLESKRSRYRPKQVYARTKREQLVITEQLAQELNGTGVVVHAMHPGWADTKGVRQWMPVFRAITRPIIRDPAQGADTIVWLGSAPEALETTGDFWQDRRRRPTHYLLGAGEDPPEARRKLWNLCQSLVQARGSGPEPAA